MDDLTPQDRAGMIGFLLGAGSRMRTRDVAKLVGLSMRGALCLMAKLSRVSPIHEFRGFWQKCGAEEENETAPVVKVS